MAITVTLSLSPEGVNQNQPVEATVVVANSDASSVTINNAKLTVAPYGGSGPVSASIGELGQKVGRPGPITVPGAGSVTLKGKVIVFDNTADTNGLSNSAEQKYSIGAEIETTDGTTTTITVATAATLTQLDLAKESQRAVLRFDETDRSCYAEVV